MLAAEMGEMHMRKSRAFPVIVLTLAGLSAIGLSGAGCGVTAVPFAQVSAIQLFDQPNYTVALSVEAAVSNPAQVQKINWTFGDGSGYEQGSSGILTTSHRYDAPGTYSVIAYVFAGDKVAAQITGSAVVSGAGGTPGPDTTPGDLPGAILGPNPANNATGVSVDIALTWTAGTKAASHDVYLGTSEAGVEAATTSDASGIFRGNQTATKYTPAAALSPDTQYYWRIDERNSSGVTKGSVLNFKTAKAPKAASDFQPADGAGGVGVAQVLGWTAGEGASSHDVYFGKNATDVENATKDSADLFKGEQSGTSYDPQDDNAEIPGQLLPSTTYYWRIDEVGLGGTLKGDLLTFTTKAAPPLITNPVPAGGATDVEVTQSLSWSAVATIQSFDVYFGDDHAAVSAAKRVNSEFKGNQSSKVYNPGTLAGSTTYYWRIDTLNAGGTTKGLVFSFTTAVPPPQVVGPYVPAHNTTNIDVNTLLSWHSGGGATTSFDVYFGTDESAVNSGASSVFQGNQNVSITEFDPLGLDPLAADTTYFWRIDAVGSGGKTTGTVLRFRTGALAGPASFPDPATNEKGVPLDAVLSWTAGLGAASYDVYLGTNQTTVQNATHLSVEFVGNVAVTTFTPSELDGDTQYYWRVDPVSSGGARKGTVWTFTTVPAQATNPTPLNAATGIAINTSLDWTAGAGATSHDVYLGTNQAAVAAATNADAEFKGNQTGTTYTPPDNPDGLTTYYWRIDEVNTDGTSIGTVWSFTTAAGEAATPIDPANGATGVELDATLTWAAGAGAVTHDVYLGTSQSAVESATRASAEFKGNQAGTAYSPPAPLTGNTSYFWRIDEVDAGNNTTKGPVWQFHTGPAQATAPIPANFATEIALDTFPQWTAGAGAAEHRVFLGTDLTAVTDATTADPEYVGTFTDTIFDPGGLTGDTWYYWRIDEVAAGGTVVTTGNVWRFRTLTLPDQVSSPNPFDGATGISTSVTLSWAAAARATGYDVYFSTVEADVISGAAFQGHRTTTSYTPGALASGTTYFWRIDSTNDAGTTEGAVWSFTTAP